MQDEVSQVACNKSRSTSHKKGQTGHCSVAEVAWYESRSKRRKKVQRGHRSDTAIMEACNTLAQKKEPKSAEKFAKGLGVE